MTDEKLTFSLNPVSPTTTPRLTSRTLRPRPHNNEPTAAPRALAPVSPSIDRSPTSPGMAAITVAPTVRASARYGPVEPGVRASVARPPTLSALPGLRSNRLTRLAHPATRQP